MADFADRVKRALSDLRQGAFHPPQDPVDLAKQMSRDSIPGISLAVVDDAKVVWKGGFGICGIDSPLPVTSSTLFQTGSISKPVFAIAVMCLVDQGILDLDQDVNNYLTSWKVPANGKWQPQVTLRQLLSHTAATSVKGFPGYPPLGPRPNLLDVLNGTWPANSPPIVIEGVPGVTFRYSGGGTTIAQQVVMDVLRKPFPILMRELVFDPMSMSISTYDQPLPEEKAACAAKGHRWSGDPVVGGAYIYPEMAAAGLWSSAEELAGLGAQLIQIWQGGHSRLALKKSGFQAMLRPQLGERENGQYFAGLGWFCDGEENAFSFGHNGEDNGFLTKIRMFPEVGKGAVVMVNSIQGGPIITQIFSALAREFEWPLSRANSFASSTIAHDYFVGSYEGHGGILAKTFIEHGNLYIKIGVQPEMELTAITKNSFGSAVADIRVNFEKSDPHGPFHIVLHLFDSSVKLWRQS